MSTVNFDLLCQKLEEIVGGDKFKSKLYLDEVRSSLDNDSGFKNIRIAHLLSTEGNDLWRGKACPHTLNPWWWIIYGDSAHFPNNL